MTRAVLLPSPFLPALAYAPLADALGRRGWGVVVADPGPAPPGPEPVLTAWTACVARERPEVLLAHSNAGRYAAAVADGIPAVYLDAALPPPSGAAPLAPKALLGHLAGLADAGGLLPPWTRWWSPEQLAAVLPDPQVLAGIRAVEPRVPLSYVQARLGARPRWHEAPQGFLAFGGTYAQETAFARAHGWPTTVLDGARHLHHLVDPDAVAAAVLDLADQLA